MGHGQQNDQRWKEERLRTRQGRGQEPGQKGRQEGWRSEEGHCQVALKNCAQPLSIQVRQHQAQDHSQTQNRVEAEVDSSAAYTPAASARSASPASKRSDFS